MTSLTYIHMTKARQILRNRSTGRWGRLVGFLISQAHFDSQTHMSGYITTTPYKGSHTAVSCWGLTKSPQRLFRWILLPLAVAKKIILFCLMVDKKAFISRHGGLSVASATEEASQRFLQVNTRIDATPYSLMPSKTDIRKL